MLVWQAISRRYPHMMIIFISYRLRQPCVPTNGSECLPGVTFKTYFLRDSLEEIQSSLSDIKALVCHMCEGRSDKIRRYFFGSIKNLDACWELWLWLVPDLKYWKYIYFNTSGVRFLTVLLFIDWWFNYSEKDILKIKELWNYSIIILSYS